MQIIRNIPNNITSKIPMAIAMGNFDGVHRGHQQLISSCISESKKNGWSSCVLTFEPHPNLVLSKDTNFKLLNTYQQKYQLIEKMGVDYLYLLDFNRELAAMDPRDFVQQYLVGALQLQKAFVGFDFTFGDRGKGTAEMLQVMGRQHGFDVSILAPVVINDQIVSSSIIREKYQEGRIEEVVQLLGYHPVIEGTVISGDKRGRKLGFPTANLALPDYILLPAFGVYASFAKINGRQLPAIINIGVKPTFGSDKPTIEAFIFDYEEDLYAQELQLTLVQRIRAEQKFPGPAELIKQIKADVAKARMILQESKLL